jgi:succinate dehydrogenase / fumarate reductase, flavoprotein subunit
VHRAGDMSRKPESIGVPVLVIGAGAAGLRTAIELTVRGVRCLVVGKRAHGDAHTRLAAGGINASLGSRDPEDRWELHFADTVREGHFVCDPVAVELLCRLAPERVRELRDWGCPFDETPAGAIDQRYFGAQSFRRTCFVGDRTGDAVLAALVDRARSLGISHRENLYVTRLRLDGARVSGAEGIDLDTGGSVAIRSSIVVLAAGGATSLFRRSSSRSDENNGDAMGLALAAGATLRDMEFIQFHPTGMVEPSEMRGRLVTEAVRGEGGHLFNARGDRFMERYSPEQMELDARDVVARAIYREIQEGRGTPNGAVLLDISHRDLDYLHDRLPGIAKRFADQGVDITREPMEVAPTAHYAMGGVQVDFRTGDTGVDGLFAVGEATGGLHGANRLGGNSLAETVVFGAIVGGVIADRAAAHDLSGVDSPSAPQPLLEPAVHRGGGEDPRSLVDEIASILWDHAAIIRTGEGLREGRLKLSAIRRRAGEIAFDPTRPEDLGSALDLRFALPVAEAILRAAELRTESRGAHHREDTPEEKPEWRKTILCRRTSGGEIGLTTIPIPPIPAHLESAVEEDRHLDYHHLE